MTPEQAQLVESQMGFVRALALKVHRRIGGRVDYEDLVSEGYLALSRCIGSFDESRGTLKTFVYRRVNGALIDFLRAEDPLSRGHRKEVGNSAHVTEHFADESDESGVKISHIPARAASPERAAIVNQAFGALQRYKTDARSRLVMALAFSECKTQAEIAAHIGVTQARVGQLVQRETHKLRAHLGVTQ